MGNENKFEYLGHTVMFGGFYEGKFLFYFGNKIISVKSIEELEKHLSSSEE